MLAGYGGRRASRRRGSTAIFNRRLTDRQPAAVVRPTTEAEVVDAVRLARERGWQVAVRSGGHSWAQWSVRDDALVIDLGRLNELSYDEATGVVSRRHPRSGAAPSSAPFLEARGRFFPGGHCPTVGIGGFLLQGGQGWNARGWGWAAEYVEAVDVVTAAGELVRASADENADLYWAARGAGPGFPGVVTRFHLRTLPAPAARRADRARLLPRRLRRGDDLAARDPRDGRRHRRDRRAHQDRPDHRAGPGPAGHRRGAGRRPGRGATRPWRRSAPPPRSTGRCSCSTPIPTTHRRAAQAAARGQPRGPPLGGRQRLALRPRRRRRPGDAPRVHHAAQRQGVHDLVLDGAAAGPARHGVLAPVRDLPGVVRRVGVAGGRRALHRMARGRDGRPRAGHRRPVPRRQRPLPPPGAVHVRRGVGATPGRSAPSATRTGCSSATWPAPTARPTATTGSSQPPPASSSATASNRPNSQRCAGSESRSAANQ